MPTWQRRTVLAACAALPLTGALAPTASAAAAETSSGSTSVGDPDGWSAPLGNAANSSYLPLDGAFEKPETVAWRYDETGTVAAVDGSVYVQTDTEIHALDADTGDREWTAEADVSGRLSVADGRVCVADDERVVAYDADGGAVAWETALGTEVPIPDLTVARETVYAIAGGSLYALDIEDGSTRWTVESVDVEPDRERFEGPEAVSFEPVSVAVADGSVYASLEGATFEYEEYDEEEQFQRAFGAVDADIGDEQWGLAFGTADNEGHIAGPIVATEHALYAPDEGGGMGWYEIDPKGGDAVRGDRVYEAATGDVRIDTGYDVSHTISAYNLHIDDHWSARSGVDAWRSLVIVGDTVVAGHLPDTAEGEDWDYPHRSIVGLDLYDGSVKWALEFDDDLPGIAAADERTLYLTADDELVAMRHDGETDGEDEESEDDSEGDDEESTDGDEDEATDDEPDDSDGDDEPGDGDDADEGGTDGDDADDEPAEEDDPAEETEADDADEESEEGEPDEDPSSGDEADDVDDTGGEYDGTDGDDTDDTGDDGDDELSGNESDSSDDTDEQDDGTGDEGDQDDGLGDDSGEDDDPDETNDSDGDTTDDGDDSVPGFTTGASLVGGAATLEWLRRKATREPPDE